jgi:hypothetical protein
MAHVYRPPLLATIAFSKGDVISLNGADYRWKCEIESSHVLTDVLTHNVTSFSSEEIHCMMANGEMTVTRAIYEAPS